MFENNFSIWQKKFVRRNLQKIKKFENKFEVFKLNLNLSGVEFIISKLGVLFL